MKIKEIRSNDTRCVGPDDSLDVAAEVMRELDVGALPVCDNERRSGMIIDRDFAQPTAPKPGAVPASGT